MKVLVIMLVVVSMVVFAGCGGKKVRPLEEEEERVTEPGAKRPGEEIEPDIEREGIKPITPGEQDVLVFKAIHFDYDKYNLTSRATATLAENATLLMDNPNMRILIEGHCDERGTDDYNLALGEKRALAARDYLVNFGIAKSRISVISYGEERPVDAGSNEEAWAKNRRDEFVIR